MRSLLAYASLILFVVTVLSFDSCKNHANESLAARIKRGDYLFNSVCNCMHCHGERDFTKFSGPTIPGTEGKGGIPKGRGIFSSNITPTVLGNWTDEEIALALTTGITKTGDTLFPVMPYYNYRHMSKDDAAGIVAYLRTLKPIPDSVPKRNLAAYPPGFLASWYQSLYLNDAGKTNIPPGADERTTRGAYLFTLGGCRGCHTPLDRKLFVFQKDSLLAGGLLFSHPGFTVRSANLTPDSATGIGSWTAETFLAKFKNYRNRKAYDYDPGKHNTDMPWSILAKMTDEDLKSIYSYLRSIKPVHNQVEKWPQ